MTERRRMRGSERRQQLLDTCAAIVDTEGFHAVTIDRVATECDVTRTVVYQHFGSLDGLLEALVARATERTAATVVATGDASSLRDAMAIVFEAVDADPATWRMFLVAPQVGPPTLTDSLARGRAAIRARNMARAEPGTDAELTARLLQAIADELVRLRLADPAIYTAERLLAQVDVVGRALLFDRFEPAR